MLILNDCDIFFRIVAFLPSVKCVFFKINAVVKKTKQKHTRNLIFFFSKFIIQMMTGVLILKCAHDAFLMPQEHVD